MRRILMSLITLVFVTGFVTGCSTPKKEENAVEAAAPEGPNPSLYARLGGSPTLEAFSNQFIQQLALNNKIMANPVVAGALSKDQKAHKEKLAILLCQISGGPCKYQGRSVKDAHAPLKITQDEWREMSRVFIQVLQSLKVRKKERQELAARVAKFKNQIVGI